MTKQVKAFVAKLAEVSQQQDTSLFSEGELMSISKRMGMQLADFSGFLDVLCHECYLLHKGRRTYALSRSVRNRHV